jgi:fatty acid desaturase
MCKNGSDKGDIASTAKEWPRFTYEDVRSHRSPKSAWIAIHGKVYDVTTFISRHPGGRVITTALGRDGSILFETHHNLLDDMSAVYKIMEKLQIGVIDKYQPVVKFDSPFGVKLLERVRAAIKGKGPHRQSFYSTSALLFFYVTFFSLIGLMFFTGSLWLTPLVAVMMSVGHLAGHAGNHWSLGTSDFLNAITSKLCTCLWGLREKYWEFSHLISHHCYNYTERDYVMEQHVPMKYFRIRPTDPWKPIHKYQHLFYLTTPITSFFLGSLRLDCAPWIFVSPLLSGLRRNHDSIAPAPQFFASGSSTEESKLQNHEDGVGPDNFIVYDTTADNWSSIFLSNVIWLPLFFHTWRNHGLIHAILLNSLSFGIQASIVTKSLLTQHLCEDIKLDSLYSPGDYWYDKQVEASTTIQKNPLIMWLTFAISFQTEHHMFPCLNPRLLVEIQPIVQQTAKEFGLQYNYFPSDAAATLSVYKQFQKLSVDPATKSD